MTRVSSDLACRTGASRRRAPPVRPAAGRPETGHDLAARIGAEDGSTIFGPTPGP